MRLSAKCKIGRSIFVIVFWPLWCLIQQKRETTLASELRSIWAD